MELKREPGAEALYRAEEKPMSFLSLSYPIYNGTFEGCISEVRSLALLEWNVAEVQPVRSGFPSGAKRVLGLGWDSIGFPYHVGEEVEVPALGFTSVWYITRFWRGYPHQA